jgi:hypothetical protein
LGSASDEAIALLAEDHVSLDNGPPAERQIENTKRRLSQREPWVALEDEKTAAGDKALVEAREAELAVLKKRLMEVKAENTRLEEALAVMAVDEEVGVNSGGHLAEEKEKLVKLRRTAQERLSEVTQRQEDMEAQAEALCTAAVGSSESQGYRQKMATLGWALQNLLSQHENLNTQGYRDKMSSSNDKDARKAFALSKRVDDLTANLEQRRQEGDRLAKEVARHQIRKKAAMDRLLTAMKDQTSFMECSKTVQATSKACTASPEAIASAQLGLDTLIWQHLSQYLQ